MKKTLAVLALSATAAFAAPAFAATGWAGLAGSQSVSGGQSTSTMVGSGWKVAGSLNSNQAYGDVAAGNHGVTTSSGSQSTNLSGSAGQGAGFAGSAGAAGGQGAAIGGFASFHGFGGF
jgi:hypothetical protein